MQIVRMTKGSWGKIRAFFDIKTEDGFTLRGFKLIEKDGLFVGFPSEKKNEGEYDDTVVCDKQLRQEVNKLAHDYYNRPEEVKAEDHPVTRTDYEMR